MKNKKRDVKQNKKKIDKIRKIKSYFLIINLVLCTFAFSYLVRGEDPLNPEIPVNHPAYNSLGEFKLPSSTPTAAEISGNSAGIDPRRIISEELANKIVPKDEKFFGKLTDFFTKDIIKNLQSALIFAAVAGGIGLIIDNNIKGTNAASSASTAAGVGYLAGALAKKLGGSGLLGAWPIGIGAGLLIFTLLFRKKSEKIVQFTCLPWQPPVGGDDCELCNNFEECTEYTCKSLGQSCEIINQGTEEQKCIWKNPQDVNSPIITLGNLSKGYKFEPDTLIRPPATGVVIEKNNGECVEAFTPLEFSLNTNEPAQCKIDYNLTQGFEEMTYYLGGSNLFKYNHSERLSLPGPDAINALAPTLENDGTYTLYARCRDSNGNFNQDAFSIRFCVDPGPDTTPPRIEAISIPSQSPIQFNITELDIEVYVNEPSECKWSRENKDYDLMENQMACSNNLWEMNNNLVYTCKTNITGIESRKENDYYFRCKDQPNANESNRNANAQSYHYVLIGTQPLNILEIMPNKTIYGSTDIVPIFLTVKTDNGYKNGESICYYSLTDNEENYIEFLETNSNNHEQRQDLPQGNYTYYIKCVDLGGNSVYNSTSFNVKVDREKPKIVRIYREAGELKIITNENAECSYSINDCNFEIELGIQMFSLDSKAHSSEWKTNQKYYIRCKDKYNNQPDPNTCSVIVKPFRMIDENLIEL